MNTQEKVNDEKLENLNIYELIELKGKMEELIEEKYFELGRKIGHNICTYHQEHYPEEHKTLESAEDVLADLKRKMDSK